MREDSNLGYDVDSFSIHELYRGLSPWQGFAKRGWKLGRSNDCFLYQENEVKIVARCYRSISNKLEK